MSEFEAEVRNDVIVKISPAGERGMYETGVRVGDSWIESKGTVNEIIANILAYLTGANKDLDWAEIVSKYYTYIGKDEAVASLGEAISRIVKRKAFWGQE